MTDDRPAILAIRQSGFLRGASPLDEERIRELPAGKPLKIVATQPRRSSQQNRLYWSLLKVVTENLDQAVTPEALHGWLKLRLGYFHTIRQRNGETVQVPASAAFDKMTHGEFTAFFQAAKDLIITQIIPGTKSAALEQAAREMLGEMA